MSDRHPGYGKKAARGAAWTVYSVGISKVASLGSQLVMGWLLSRGDFGIYAIAIAFSTLALMLKNGGTESILVQRGSEFSKLVPAVLRLALGFNVAAAIALAVFAPVLSGLYDAPELRNLCWIIAASIPLATPVCIYKARLSIDLSFGVLARISAVSSLVRYGSMTLFVLAGFGVYSFVLPLLLVGIYEWHAYKKAANIDLPWQSKGCRGYGEVFRDSKWVLVGAGAVALSTQGDYLVIGLIEAKEVVGSYFFGFQLLVSVVVLFTQSIQLVMLPSLVRIVDDKQRLQRGYVKVLRILAFISMPMGVVIVLLAQPVISLLWAGKWDSTIVVVQLLGLSFPSWVFVRVTRSIFEAKGRWRLRTLMLFIDAFGVMLAAFIGAHLGGLPMIALWMMLYRSLFSIITLTVGARLLNLTLRSLTEAIAPPVLLALLCGGAAWLVVVGLADTASPNMLGLVAALSFVVGFTALGSVLQRERVREVYAFMRSAFR